MLIHENRTFYISVIICTFNRSNRLEMLFDAIRRQQNHSTFHTEFIFIDNNSTDDTRTKIESFKESTSFSVSYLIEKKRGSSAARNKGILKSSGSVVAFLDDDCLPSPQWLANIAEYFSNEDIDVAGGKVLLNNPLDLPLSIRTSDEETRLENIEQLFGTIPGCNMVFRRHVLEKIGVFDEDLGAGLPLAAEDVDLIYRALRNGYHLRYTPKFCVFHDHGRRTLNDARLLDRSYLRGRGGMYAKYSIAKDWQIARSAYWEICSLCRKAIKPPIKGEPSLNYIKEVVYIIQGFVLVSWRVFVSKKHSVPNT